MKRKQLLSLCEFTSRSIASPFLFTWDNSSWDCATDGKAAIMLRNASWDEISIAPDLKKFLLSPMNKCDKTFQYFNLLEYSFGETVICKYCNGSGFLDNVDEDEFCRCDNGLLSVQYGSIGDVVFNRRLLYKFLLIGSSYVKTDCHRIHWRDKESPIFVRDATPNMIIALMPMKHATGDDEAVPLDT